MTTRGWLALSLGLVLGALVIGTLARLEINGRVSLNSEMLSSDSPDQDGSTSDAAITPICDYIDVGPIVLECWMYPADIMILHVPSGTLTLTHDIIIETIREHQYE